MTLNISREQARRFLTLYHFTPTDLMGTIERLATVQYDPLNPVGRNPDLIYGTFPFVVISGDNHQPVALHAVSPPGVAQPLIPPGRSIPLGSVQVS